MLLYKKVLLMTFGTTLVNGSIPPLPLFAFVSQIGTTLPRPMTGQKPTSALFHLFLHQGNLFFFDIPVLITFNFTVHGPTIYELMLCCTAVFENSSLMNSVNKRKYFMTPLENKIF